MGAGAVGEEKLRFILKSSPNARVTVVAPWMGEELRNLLEDYQRAAYPDLLALAQVQGEESAALEKLSEAKIESDLLSEAILESEDGLIDVSKLRTGSFVLHDTYYSDMESLGGLYATQAGGYVMWLKCPFEPAFVEMGDLIVAATDIKEVNRAVYTAAKDHRRLCNIADTPELCDFYLGSIVTRGPLKVAISTNGQSPTFAKRFRQWLEAELPELETTSLLDNLKLFRDRLTGDFQTKVRELNNVTSSLLSAAADQGTARRCPPGGCLLAAASEADPTDPAPASATKSRDPRALPGSAPDPGPSEENKQ